MTLTPKFPVLEVSGCSPKLVVYCKPQPPHPRAFLGVSRGRAILNESMRKSSLSSGLVPLWCGGVPANCPTTWLLGSMARSDYQSLRSHHKLGENYRKTLNGFPEAVASAKPHQAPHSSGSVFLSSEEGR